MTTTTTNTAFAAASTIESGPAPITHKLTATTLADLIAVGERMAKDGDYLEKLIWQIKAEAYAQFKDATAKYLADEQKVQGSGVVQDVVNAGNRIGELEKLWSQAVALRNRGVHFAASQLESTESTASRWPALQTVFDARVERK